VRRGVFLVPLLAALCVVASAGAATVELDRTHLSTGIGKKFTFTTTVRNEGEQALSGVVAHLNVLSSDPGVYVDPEDWSSQRTRYLAPIPAQGATKISWTVTAVNSGSITIFVAVLPRHGSGSIAVSEPLRVDIAKRRTLNSGGVLPLALGLPALLGLSALGTRVRRRRSRV
jgi:hypothetical protein